MAGSQSARHRNTAAPPLPRRAGASACSMQAQISPLPSFPQAFTLQKSHSQTRRLSLTILWFIYTLKGRHRLVNSASGQKPGQHPPRPRPGLLRQHRPFDDPPVLVDGEVVVARVVQALLNPRLQVLKGDEGFGFLLKKGQVPALNVCQQTCHCGQRVSCWCPRSSRISERPRDATSMARISAGDHQEPRSA